MGEGCTRKGQILNRVVRATTAGLEMEAGQRRAELIIEQLPLRARRGGSTPGVDGQYEHEEDAPEALGPQEATSFRDMAPRCNFLSADRPDITFPVKQLCCEMSKPTLRSMMRLERG